jgi:dihydrofolate synthase/folylpolyglutamate synthase
MDPLEYLYSLEKFGSKLELTRMRNLMEALEYPYRVFPSIHVGGTNGKGSVCAFLDSVLREAGYKVGLYTSPHLVNFNERIRVNGKEIGDEELKILVEEIRKKIEEEKLEGDNPEDTKNKITFFEFTTAIAFLYFKKMGVDIAVIEVGMGGRLDATNVILPEVSVITNIDYDHMESLGDTKEKIAREKAGIIKFGVPLVTAEDDPKIMELLEGICRERSSSLYRVGVECGYPLGMMGIHQRKNAAVAGKVLELLSNGLQITEEAKRRGFWNARWMGRLEQLGEKPRVLVDCAHNVAGIRVLIDYLRNLERRKVLVLGIAKDKQIPEMVSLIAPLFEKVVVTRGNFKPAEPEIIAAEARKYVPDVEVVPEVEKAIRMALSKAEKEDLILFAGSIYMVGDVLKLRKMFK